MCFHCLEEINGNKLVSTLNREQRSYEEIEMKSEVEGQQNTHCSIMSLGCWEKSQDEGRSTFIYYTEWNMMWQVQKTLNHTSQHLLDICEEAWVQR